MNLTDRNSGSPASGSGERSDLSTELAMGGQAVIEGVLMRGPHRVAVAVRRPSGEVVVNEYAYTSVTRRIKLLGLPVIRGAIGLVESLKIGIEALNWSAEQAAEDDETTKKPSALGQKLWTALSLLIGLVLALGLFMYFPLWVGRAAAEAGGADSASQQIVINAVAGAVRVTLLLAYLWGVSRWKEIRRVFQYHGSEHKTIFAFEGGQALSAEAIMKRSRFHPRCGTSFLLIVALSAIVFFAVVDSLVVGFIREYPSVWARFLVHLALIPVLAGLSYEFLRYSAKRTDNRIVKALIQPGLWLQRITTQEPDSSMCEVALTALNHALGQPQVVVTGSEAGVR